MRGEGALSDLNDDKLKFISEKWLYITRFFR